VLDFWWAVLGSNQWPLPSIPIIVRRQSDRDGPSRRPQTTISAPTQLHRC
jgi:hypothetical protein